MPVLVSGAGAGRSPRPLSLSLSLPSFFMFCVYPDTAPLDYYYLLLYPRPPRYYAIPRRGGFLITPSDALRLLHTL